MRDGTRRECLEIRKIVRIAMGAVCRGVSNEEQQ